MYGNGWPGSKASGVKTGQTRWLKIVLQKCLDLRRVVRRFQDGDLLLAEKGPQRLIPAVGDFAEHGFGADANHGEALAGGKAVGHHHLVPRPLLPGERRHTHHEKLVEVVGGNGQKLHAFEQRIRLRPRLGEHPFVEGEPAHLAVDVERRV
jgi:hypothetical protein